MITVLFFGMLKEKTSRESLSVSVDSPVSVRQLLRTIASSVPEVGAFLEESRALVAVNRECVEEDAVLRDGDEVALMPPFSGGSERPENGSKGSHAAVWTRIQAEDFSVDEELDRVKKVSTRIGGIAVFLGTARDFSRGQRVDRLAFEHYAGMAEQQLTRIRDEAKKRYTIIECLLIHRTGEIPVGGHIVLVIVASEHRADALNACQWCIDELKATTPIWKKEMTPQGGTWVQDRP